MKIRKNAHVVVHTNIHINIHIILNFHQTFHLIVYLHIYTFIWIIIKTINGGSINIIHLVHLNVYINIHMYVYRRVINGHGSRKAWNQLELILAQLSPNLFSFCLQLYHSIFNFVLSFYKLIFGSRCSTINLYLTLIRKSFWYISEKFRQIISSWESFQVSLYMYMFPCCPG